MEASIKDMTEGPYTATCRLMKDGEEVGTSHTVSFSVGHVPDGPSGDEHFCPSCKLADSCGGVSLGECGGKGTCHNGACICFADYAGDQCEVPLTVPLPQRMSSRVVMQPLPSSCYLKCDCPNFSCFQHSILRDTAFLPSVDPRDSPSACQKSIVWEHGSRNLQSTLASLGSAHDCRLGASVSHQVIGGVLPFGPPMHGLGFNLHYVSHMLGWGLSAGRVPVLVESPALGRWAYGSHPDCDAEGWLCFFEPLSPCDSYASQLGADYSASVHNRSGGIPRVALQPPEEFARWVPGREETYHGRLWWRSQLISRILRPTSLLLSMARQARLRMGLRPPYISVHVRMGDACTHAARKSPAGGLEGCVPVLEYVDAARTLAERFGCNRVFLATDSEEAVEAFDAAGDLEVMHLALERGRLFGSTWLIEERLRAGVVDADQVVQARPPYILPCAAGHVVTNGAVCRRSTFASLV